MERRQIIRVVKVYREVWYVVVVDFTARYFRKGKMQITDRAMPRRR